MNTDVAKLYHVRSEFNPSDIGSRPDKIKLSDVGPESSWEKGLPWMEKALETAIDEDIIKPANELRFENTEDKDQG